MESWILRPWRATEHTLTVGGAATVWNYCAVGITSIFQFVALVTLAPSTATLDFGLERCVI